MAGLIKINFWNAINSSAGVKNTLGWPQIEPGAKGSAHVHKN